MYLTSDIDIFLLKRLYDFYIRIKQGTFDFLKILLIVIIFPVFFLFFFLFLLIYPLWFNFIGIKKLIKSLESIIVTDIEQENTKELYKIIMILLLPPVQRFYKSITFRKKYLMFTTALFILRKELGKLPEEKIDKDYSSLFYDWDSEADTSWQTI